MATATPSKAPMDASTALQIAAQLKEASSQFPEPVRGTLNYAGDVSHDPGIDRFVCEQAGKVVRVFVRTEKPVDQPLTLRGNLGPLTWNTDFADDKRSANETHLRTFTFQVPKEQIDDELQFKVLKGSQWSVGENWARNMKSFGHLATIEVKDVAF